MNLHGIVSGAIGTVNPLVPVQIKVSTGYVTADDGTRLPGYAPPATVMAQIQALSYNDIIQADNLNIQGVRRKMYIQGEVDGLVRPNNKGGDLVLLPDGSTWLVAMVDEHWPDWTAAIITLQNGA